MRCSFVATASPHLAARSGAVQVAPHARARGPGAADQLSDHAKRRTQPRRGRHAIGQRGHRYASD
eukprot:574282-Ditylum_brightwellii.AAC.1